MNANIQHLLTLTRKYVLTYGAFVLSTNLHESPLSYSVGFIETFNHPEICITGLDVRTSYEILNSLRDKINKGKTFLPSPDEHEGIIQNSKVLFREIHPSNFKEFGFGELYYKTYAPELCPLFAPIQMMWKDKNGFYRFDDNYNLEECQADLGRQDA